MKTKRIITKDKEIYDKMNLLNHSSEVTIRDKKNLPKMLNSMNKLEKVVDVIKIGKYVTIKKINPIKFDVFLRK